jgi:DNA-binding LacI/PurR family transcriptional regulator
MIHGLNSSIFHRPVLPEDLLENMADNLVDKGQEIARWDDRPSAIVASSDFCAVGLMQGLTMAGVKIPQDVSLTGFDHVQDYCMIRPRLTTVGQPHEMLSETAVNMLTQMINNVSYEPGQVWLPPELLVFNSTAQVR